MGGIPCLMSEGRARLVLYSKVQYIMDKGHMGIPPEQNERQTPSRNFVGRRHLKVVVCL